MVYIHWILILIESFALFFQGFSLRRRNMLMMLISSIFVLLSSGLAIILKEIGVYVHTFSNVYTYDVMVSIVYVLFWLISGYIVGGFRRVKVENMVAIKVR